MKNKFTILVVILLFLSNSIFAQNVSPVAVDDTITVNSGGTYTFSPWANDYDPDGDPFYIFTASFLHGSGIVSVSYSSIDIKMNYSTGIDTIVYFLKDNHNNMSNKAYIFVTINNNHTNDTLNFNNVSAPFFPIGNAFWDHIGIAQFEVPKGSSKTTIFTSVPWIAGLDSNNNLHIAEEQFTAYGNDYFYGPVCDTNMLWLNSDSAWNRVWKITKNEIDYHKTNYWKSNYVVPEAIVNWPANGDTLIGQNLIMAPFIDNNNDGIYSPNNGDYPKIRGDESIFIIFNDSKKPHTESKGLPLGVEFHQTAYAYDCQSDSALYNTIFVHYDIYNRSNRDYHNVFFLLFTDFDIGYGQDDFIGCDSSRSLYYGYNGLSIDGYNMPNFAFPYGANPPAQGVVFLSENLSSFMISNNSGLGVPEDPHNQYACYNYMQANWADSTHITYGGYGRGGTTTTDYMFSGDPNDTTTWSDRKPFPDTPSVVGSPGDRRAYGSMGPFTLNSGGVKSIDLAYVYARDTTKSNFENVAILKAMVDKIRLYYDNDSTPCGGSFSAIDKSSIIDKSLRVYPNPVENKFYIDYLPFSSSSIYELYDINGKLIKYGKLKKKKTNVVNVDELNPGFYILRILDGLEGISKKLIIH